MFVICDLKLSKAYSIFILRYLIIYEIVDNLNITQQCKI